MSSFSSVILKSINDTKVKIDRHIVFTARKLFTRIVQLTPSPARESPYSRGLLANQWYVGVSSISDELSSAISEHGADSLSRIESIPFGVFAKKDGMVSLANNVSYAFQAEYIGWAPPRWRGASPYGMVQGGIAYIKSHGRI